MVLCPQDRTLYTHVHTRAPAAIPVRCPLAHREAACVSGSKRTHQTRAGMSAGSKEKERKASAERRKRHVSRVCAEAGPTSGDTRGEGAEAARGRCGGERAPLGELGVDEQRAGTSSVTRLACREGSNGARQQWKQSRGRNTRAMRATTRAARCGIARRKRGLGAGATYPRVGGAGGAHGTRGLEEARGAPSSAPVKQLLALLSSRCRPRWPSRGRPHRSCQTCAATTATCAISSAYASSATPPPRKPVADKCKPHEQGARSVRDAPRSQLQQRRGGHIPQERGAGVAAPRREDAGTRAALSGAQRTHERFKADARGHRRLK